MELQDDKYCYNNRNTTCKKGSASTSFYVSLYTFFSLLSVVTVFLNLLVIISISHFKHLQTPTNLLILSLAVSDLLVGLIAIPASTVAIMEPCWVLGKYFCALLMYINYVLCCSSLGNLILISIDRYVAVCDPLMYHMKITTSKTICCISINWFCCVIYEAVLVHLTVNIQVPRRCYEECLFVQGDMLVTVFDLVISMAFPCSIILTLYLKIFVVARSQARSQARKVFSKVSATVSGVKTVQASKSERKAAKTLGLVVFLYLLCWLPIYFTQLIFLSSGDTSSVFTTFLPLVNSFINPVIYAFFYPWFKVAVKRILTLNLRQV